MQLDAGIQINIAWQLLAYVIITMAEVFVSITCLEFSYTQAPKKMKSFIMSAYLLSVSLGNILLVWSIFSFKMMMVVAITGADYYLFFAGCMLFTAFSLYPMLWFIRKKHIFRMMTIMNQRLAKE